MKIMNIMNMLKKCVAVVALVVSMSVGTTAIAAEITVTPVQATFLTNPNTVVYLTADLSTPTECILPENFTVNVTGVTNTGSWEIEINGLKFYIVGGAVKAGQPTVAEQTPVTEPATVTLGMKNALKKAKSYLKISSFSRQGLIDQLAYNGFLHEECVYAVDHCGVNWTLECVDKAKSYLKISSFSRQGLIDQLAYNGFAETDCVYAVDNCGADWNSECVEKAQSYLKISSFSRQGLMDQLSYNRFTQEQIAYAITAVGY